MTLIISGFPGVGKTHLCQNHNGLNVIDSDSSKFSWESPGVRHPEFPDNYMRHIRAHCNPETDVILVSTHQEVRSALDAAGLKYIIVCPDVTAKEEYLKRFVQRGSPLAFVELMEKKWDDFIESVLDCEPYQMRIVLGRGQYLADVLEWKGGRNNAS